MNKEEKIRNEVEQTLNSMEMMQEIEPNPYLFTRLKAEIETTGTSKTKTSLSKYGILKPAALFLFVLLNLFTSFYIVNSNTTTEAANKQTYLSAISSEYNINQTYNSQIGMLMGN